MQLPKQAKAILLRKVIDIIKHQYHIKCTAPICWQIPNVCRHRFKTFIQAPLRQILRRNSYDIFPEVPARLAEHGIRLHYLATWRDVLAEARRGSYFDPATMDEVEGFLDHPLEWSAAHGGTSKISI